MSYWNDAEIIFEADGDEKGFLGYWGKFKKEDSDKSLGVAWSDFPSQIRQGMLAPVVIPSLSSSGNINRVIKSCFG